MYLSPILSTSNIFLQKDGENVIHYSKKPVNEKRSYVMTSSLWQYIAWYTVIIYGVVQSDVALHLQVHQDAVLYNSAEHAQLVHVTYVCVK